MLSEVIEGGLGDVPTRPFFFLLITKSEIAILTTKTARMSSKREYQ